MYRVVAYVVLVFVLLSLATQALDAADYDPLKVSSAEIKFGDWTVRD